MAPNETPPQNRRWIRKVFVWPDVLRWRGSVLPTILPSMILMSTFAYVICVLQLQLEIHVSLPNSVVPSLSVVLGLLLAFRTNTAYDRFWEGRRLWQTVATTTRNLARLIWINIPERTKEDRVEKMRSVKLLLAYSVAVKHHLREEYGTDYYDLDVLLPPNWVPAAASSPPLSPTSPRQRHTIEAVLEAATSSVAAGVVAGVAAAGNIITGGPSSGDPSQSQPDDPNDPVNSPIGQQTHAGTSYAPLSAEEDLPSEADADMSLPLEIVFRLGLYVNQAKSSGKIDSSFQSTITSGLNTLIDCLGNFERILYTPIPKAYNIHLKQAVALYLIALPFTLVAELGWFVVPMIGLVSFTLFGIEGIGSEIENPFGYDDNDLPLNLYCEELKKEVEFIIYHIPSETESVLLNGK
ncbi:Bestrophin, RFP-TM, chloride channel-domain-containing protein [Jimgerdemannia flammicorona]|uniref:Bestrophin, RFP-TM, chloride channel-domain-containing protein n=1 Tax=Jimgerdemannia flammicorona TaxID=994334 RepID=A0A433DCI7_9FUNG|nr:Bestrophin, RFP-TM, chloride channel-domain-containing protein [Jimgerdemannia flammicorona]